MEVDLYRCSVKTWMLPVQIPIAEPESLQHEGQQHEQESRCARRQQGCGIGLRAEPLGVGRVQLQECQRRREGQHDPQSEDDDEEGERLEQAAADGHLPEEPALMYQQFHQAAAKGLPGGPSAEVLPAHRPPA